MAFDINTKSGYVMPKDAATTIFDDAQDQSIVMQLANRISCPGNGQSFPVITGDSEASWVNETDEIAVSNGTTSHKDMSVYKLACIITMSSEMQNDETAIANELRRRLPNAIAKKFDATVFGKTAPGGDFDVLGAATAINLADATASIPVYSQILTAKEDIAEANGNMNGIVLAPKGETLALSAVDGNKRPLFIQNLATDSSVNYLAGVREYGSKHVFVAGTPNTIGFAGDWSQAYYGVCEDIKVTPSTEATVTIGSTQVNLYSHDMIAYRCIARVGFIVRDPKFFVKFTDGAAA